MYTKISHGTNFMGAALYDAEGLSNTQKAQKAGKVELLETTNLLSIDAPGIAQEMEKVASYSRSQKPVWNISMSAPEGVRLTAEQWQQAAAENLRVMGAKPENHQYAIYRHSDTQQDHIHILFNSVPVDGGPALSRQFKAAKAKLAAPQIDQLLGILSHKGESILDEIGRKLATALTHRPTNPDELKSDLAQSGVTAHYATNAKGVYGITFQVIDRDHKPVKGSDVLIDGEKAKWSTLAALLATNRAHYEAEIERLRQEHVQAEKSREIAEEGLKQAQQEIKQVYEKRDLINHAFHQAEKARQQAERERDQARNQPAKVEIQKKEIIKSDPKDQARIRELEKENRDLKGQLNLSSQLRTIKGVETTPEQRALLLAGQSIRLNGLVHPSHGLYDAHVMIKTISPTEKRLSYKVIGAPDAVKPQVDSGSAVSTAPVMPQAVPIQKPLPLKPAVVPERPAHHPTPEVPQAAPTQKSLSPELPVLDIAVVEQMRQIMIKAAKKSKTWDGFSATLRSEGVKRQKLETGQFTYAYKNVQATAAELGFKTGEIKNLLEQRTQKIGR